MRRKFTRVKRKLNKTRKLQKGGSQTKLFRNTYVISTDNNSARFKNIENKAKVAGLSIQYWPAVVMEADKKLFKELPLQGIGLTNFIDRKLERIYNLGTIGCFLSHRNLLEYLSHSNTLGTLILEDDAEIPPDLFQKLDIIVKELPGDWDILFLDKGGNKSETPVSKHIVKIKQTLDPYVCYGTYSYIVKNSSIKKKILPCLKYMTNHLDQQYTTYADVINEYISYGIIPINHKYNAMSTINKEDFKNTTLNKKILIIMSDNRPLGKHYNSLTACINYEYSKKHGYDFIYYRPYLNDKTNYELNNCLDSKGNPRHASWSKILSTKKALELKYDYIVYIDSDCIFKDFSRTIEQYIKPFAEKDIMFLNDKPWGTMYPCAGFYVCKVSSESKRLMKDWYAIDLPENNMKHPWEQAALMKIFKEYNVQLIDDWMFRERQGQFLRHIGTDDKQNREPYFKNFIKTMGIDVNTIIPKIKVIDYNTRDIN
jgi:GR25 family glycosyltransferase involved in LPS biosynthesis